MDGLERIRQEKPDLVILDLHLPGMSGETVCREIREQWEQMPILILTGQDDEGLSARCLNGGADGYLVKPFEIDNVLAHVKALLRRANYFESAGKMISKGLITIRLAERVVIWKGKKMQRWAPKEFQLLCLLVSQSPRVLDKNTLAMKAWGLPFNQVHERTLDVHIRRIRQKLGPTAASCLRTIPSVGFQWLDMQSTPSPADSSASN